jgi:hypothetical protein
MTLIVGPSRMGTTTTMLRHGDSGCCSASQARAGSDHETVLVRVVRAATVLVVLLAMNELKCLSFSGAANAADGDRVA